MYKHELCMTTLLLKEKGKKQKTKWREYYFNGSLDNQRRQAK